MAAAVHEKLLASWTVEGRFMGSFRIEETIGNGQSGQVVAAAVRPDHPAVQDTGTDRMCLKLALERSPGAETVLREIDMHSTLRERPHPHVCWVYEAGRGQLPGYRENEIYDVCYLLMHRHRCDMLHVVERAPLSIRGATGLLAQTIDGLAHIHRAGIAHRDIKLDNLLVREDYNVAIADFGYATRHPVSHTRCGTVGYVAPEVGSPHGYATKPVDVWSAGISFAVSILGTFPWAHDAPEDVRAQQIQWFLADREPCERLETTRKLLHYMLHPNPLFRLRPETLDVVTRDHACNETMRQEVCERCGEMDRGKTGK